ncbi:MAG: hypothetical protein JW953_12310 [Anaerolineae bacterium]|nr:hypothetical protein [Anaerolineae bacterium]
MLTLETHHLVYQEQVKDWLREKQYRQLLGNAGRDNGVSLKLYRRAVNWLGMQLVKGGLTLQNLATASPAEHVTVNR